MLISLVMQSLLKHTDADHVDYIYLLDAVNIMQSVCDQINAKMAEKANENAILLIQTTVIACPVPKPVL